MPTRTPEELIADLEAIATNEPPRFNTFLRTLAREAAAALSEAQEKLAAYERAPSDPYVVACLAGDRAELHRQLTEARQERDRLAARQAEAVKAIADMQRASALADEASGPVEYNARLVALALIARQFLRDAALTGGDSPEPSDVDVQLLAWAVSNCHMLARRALARTTSVYDREKWEHVLRICEKAGARSHGVLRAAVPTEITDGGDRPKET